MVSGFLFRAVSICVAFCEAQRALLVTLSRFSPISSFLSPTTPVVIHGLHFPQVWLRRLHITQDLQIESTSPTVFPILPPSPPFSCSNRPRDLPLEFTG
jgi:hypothetical protein